MAFLYSYVDLDNIIQDVSDDTLNFAGNWDSQLSYFSLDVVLFGDSRYIALTASQGSTPPNNAVRDDRWSILTLVSTGTLVSGTNATDALDLAELALSRANYAISIAGTATGGGDSGLAQLALETAWVGTNAGDQAYDIAVSALSTAWVGTNAGDQSYDIAVSGLETAWVGTNAGDQAYDVAQDAYRLAVAGTEKTDNLIDTILTTMNGNVVVNSSGNVVTSGP